MNHAYALLYRRVGLHGGRFTEADAVFYLIALVALYLFSWFKICQKSGKHWTHLLIPFYNLYYVFRIAGCEKYFPLLAAALPIFLIGHPIAYAAGGALLLAAHIIHCMYLSRAFGQDRAFAVGLILLHPVFLIKLGTEDREYILDKKRPDAWTCACGTLNPISRSRCEHCGERNPSPLETLPAQSEEEWTCECGLSVEMTRDFCPRCGQGKPPVFRADVRPWRCKCGEEHAASRMKCPVCGEEKPRPKNGLETTAPSVWRCACRRTNSFAHAVCPQCGRARPDDLTEILRRDHSDTL